MSALTPARDHPVSLDGGSLTLADLASIVAGAPALVDPSALKQARLGQEAADRVTAERHVYGRTTGVGAGREEVTSAPVSHGLRLLRAHAAGWGEPLPADVVRCALAIRANQLLVGGSGASPDLAVALAELACGPEGDLPVVHRYGGLGTGDLTACAEVGLALLGERPRADGGLRRRLQLTSADALPLMSSNAFTLAQAALGALALRELAAAANTVASLTWLGLRGNPESVDPAVERATPFPGAARAARVVRGLIREQEVVPQYIQDFFGLRTWPQVHGPVLDAVDQLAAVVEASVNTSSENPLFTPATATTPDTVTHHGGFHAAYLVLAIDTTMLALCRSAQAVQSRISHLLTDRDHGLPLFLSDATQGSSGVLIGEYVAGSALALIIGHASAPASIQTVGVSAGIEDDASFAGLAAVRVAPALEAYRRMLGVELLCALRALRLRGTTVTGRLGEVVGLCSVLPADLGDHDVLPDLDAAEALVGDLAAYGQPWPSTVVP
jgi:histidine ammonia-lyase